jgi:peptidoglycan/xylan/chitin deacetylase (PgdA/CDA1 family)
MGSVLFPSTVIFRIKHRNTSIALRRGSARNPPQHSTQQEAPVLASDTRAQVIATRQYERRWLRMELKRPIKCAIGAALRLSGMYKKSFDSRMSIVAFHRVNDELPPDSLTCSSADFELFCQFFKDHFMVVPLSEQVRACYENRPTGGTVSITLDDGYLDNYTVAAPILERLGLPATFFVTTSFIGTQHVPPWDADLPMHPGWMTWEQVRDLASRGFDIGAHTQTHIDMGHESADVIAAELAGSRLALEQALGREVRLFAYPFGGPENITETARTLVRDAGFTCCLSCDSGTNPVLPNPFYLRRLPISHWYLSPDQMTAELALNPFMAAVRSAH